MESGPSLKVFEDRSFLVSCVVSGLLGSVVEGSAGGIGAVMEALPEIISAHRASTSTVAFEASTSTAFFSVFLFHKHQYHI